MRSLALLSVAVATLALGGNAADVLTATPLWTFDQNEGTYCSPSLRNNTVFVGGASGAVHALDRNFGTLLWSAQVNDAVNGSIGFDDIMIDAPEIYVPTVFGSVFALNGATGQQVWNRSTESSGIYNRPAVYNRTVYVEAIGYGVWILNATGGRGTTDSGSGVTVERAVDGRVYVFVGTTTGSVLQLDLRLDSMLCDFFTPMVSTPLFHPIVMGPLVIVNDGVGHLFAVDYTMCQHRWTRTLPFGPNATVRGNVAAVHELSLVVVASANGQVAAVDAFSGSLRWSTNISDLHFSSMPLAADGYVFVLDLSGVIAVLSAANGTLLQRVTGPQATTPRSRLAYGGGVLVATFGETVAAFGLTAKTTPATNVPTVPPTDTVAPASFVVMSHCAAFNCASGCEHAKYPLNTCVALSNSTSVYRTCARSEMRVQVFDSSDSCASGTSSSTRYYKLGQCFNEAESGSSFVVESC